MPATRPLGKLRLGVNIDHVATVRNARGGDWPDPVRAAKLAEAAGADGITAHLREDRRHIRDADMERLATELGVPLNFEMAATEEMRALALRLRPHACCLVPERREERTTEGGLDVAGDAARLRDYVGALAEAGIRVSLFIGHEARQIEAAAAVGAAVVELHTGAYCDFHAEGRTAERDCGAGLAPRRVRPRAWSGVGGSCRTRAFVRDGGAGRGISGGDGAEHRPFSHR